MPKLPLPADAEELLRKPNPAVIATLREDGSPHTAVTWYVWEDGRVLVNMDVSRVRLKHLRRDPRVSLTVLDTGDVVPAGDGVRSRRRVPRRHRARRHRPALAAVHAPAVPKPREPESERVDRGRGVVRLAERRRLARRVTKAPPVRQGLVPWSGERNVGIAKM